LGNQREKDEGRKKAGLLRGGNIVESRTQKSAPHMKGTCRGRECNDRVQTRMSRAKGPVKQL